MSPHEPLDWEVPAPMPDIEQLAIDALRVVTIGGALLIILAVGRLVWLRRHAPPEHRHHHVHAATMASYCMLLGIVIARRSQGLGEPLDWFGAIAALAVASGLYGVSRRLAVRDVLTRLAPTHRP